MMVVLPVGCMAFIYCWLQMVVACRVLAADPAADAAITNVVFMGECAALRCGERQLCNLESLYWWMVWPFIFCGILSASLTTPFRTTHGLFHVGVIGSTAASVVSFQLCCPVALWLQVVCWWLVVLLLPHL
jgi:hypothetical protein